MGLPSKNRPDKQLYRSTKLNSWTYIFCPKALDIWQNYYYVL